MIKDLFTKSNFKVALEIVILSCNNYKRKKTKNLLLKALIFKEDRHLQPLTSHFIFKKIKKKNGWHIII